MKTKIVLDRYKPREFQYELFEAFEEKKFRKLVLIWPRRAGKDVTAFNLILREAIRKVGVYYYIFPSYAQARKVVWDSITNEGKRFLDFIPKELIAKTHSQEMKITLANNSIIQLIGSDNIDAIVGSNPRGCVFSEYALQDPQAYQFIRPILAANDGWSLFISTPRGKNHFWDLYQIGLKSKDWYVSKLTLEDTQHIPLEEVEREREEGLMSEDLIQQEYYTSFEMGVQGSYYSKYLEQMNISGQIGRVPWEPSAQVHTAWDLGVRDSTAIIFFQAIGRTIRIIDYYEKNKEGLEHYAKIVKEKPYLYGKHFGPHDLAVREFSTGMTRISKARELGIRFTVVDNIPIADGIEAVRSALPRTWIDENKCADLIKCLENYRQEYDERKKVYKTRPLHNFASHGADAMRYLCVALPKTRDGLSPQELDRRYKEALYGDEHQVPDIFSNRYRIR